MSLEEVEDNGVTRIREILPDKSLRQNELIAKVYGTRDVVLYLSDIHTGDHSERARRTALCMELNLSFARVDGNMDRYQRSIFYLGPIICLLYGKRDALKASLTGMGYNIRAYSLPRESAEAMVDLPQIVPDASDCAIKFAILVLFLFKNVNTTSYEKYLLNRLRALGAVCGNPLLTPSQDYVFADASHAEDYRTCFGASLSLRREVVNTVVNVSSDQDVFGYACDYIARILAWTDMSGLLFVIQMLLAPGSPVLYDPEVAHEVLNLFEIMRTICRCRLPQYFKIIGDPEEIRVLDRSKFPILLAVAQALKEDAVSTVQNFAKPRQIREDLVVRLASKHREHFKNRDGNQTNVDGARRYLTQMDRMRSSQTRTITEPVNPQPNQN